jgi:uncharacterized SAM-binding protein YcdF (DUF218 family)
MEFIPKFRVFFSKSLLNPSIWIYWFILGLYFLEFQYYVVAFSIIFVVLFNFLPYYLIKKLELKYPLMDTNCINSFYHILVLGGGHNPDSSGLWEQQLNNSSLRRVLEGIRLFKLNEYSNLVMSGHSLKLGYPSQAEIQGYVAETMGINKNSIIYISEPANTEQEAFFYKRNVNTGDIPIVIVTKALHLRRALFIFSSHGFKTYCAPAYYSFKEFDPSLLWFLFPDFRLILLFGEYLKEIVGYYFMLVLIFMGFKDLKSEVNFRNSSLEFEHR